MSLRVETVRIGERREEEAKEELQAEGCREMSGEAMAEALGDDVDHPARNVDEAHGYDVSCSLVLTLCHTQSASSPGPARPTTKWTASVRLSGHPPGPGRSSTAIRTASTVT